jgi:hypothetical protein
MVASCGLQHLEKQTDLSTMDKSQAAHVGQPHAGHACAVQSCAAVGAANGSSAPAHSQAVTVDGQVSTAGCQQRELGDHLLGELQDRKVQDEKYQFECMPQGWFASLCAINAHLPIRMQAACLQNGVNTTAAGKFVTRVAGQLLLQDTALHHVPMNMKPAVQTVIGQRPAHTWCGPYTLLPRVMMMGSLYEVM